MVPQASIWWVLFCILFSIKWKIPTSLLTQGVPQPLSSRSPGHWSDSQHTQAAIRLALLWSPALFQNIYTSTEVQIILDPPHLVCTAPHCPTRVFLQELNWKLCFSHEWALSPWEHTTATLKEKLLKDKRWILSTILLLMQTQPSFTVWALIHFAAKVLQYVHGKINNT